MRTQVKNAAMEFASHCAERYGVISALSRARMITHEYPKNRIPQWLTEAIAILEQKAKDETART